jgi:hypothetical protein
VILPALLFAAAATSPSTVSAIDAFCDPLAKAATRDANAPRIFADLADSKKPDASWGPVKDKATLDRLVKNDAAYSQAFVWKTEAGTFVLMYFTSPSGDWASYVDSCYRADGSLARSVGTLNTFLADADDAGAVSRIRKHYFAPDGHGLQTTTRFVKAKTNKKAKAFSEEDDQLFKSVRELPFAALLEKPAK